MIAAAYVRKSTQDKRSGTAEASTQQQLAEARSAAYAAGHVLDPRYCYEDEAISGAEFSKRAGLVALLAALKPAPPFQVLYITDRDRLGREQIETSYVIKQIIQAGVTIIETRTGKPLTLDGPVDKIILSVTAFAGELERQQARVRTRAAMVSKALAGFVTGGAIYGYDNQDVCSPEGKRLHVLRVINETQAHVVVRIFERVAQGAGFRKIAHELNQAHLPAPRPSKNDKAKGWCPSTVRAVVHRELYRGLVVWGKTIKRDAWGRKQSAQRAEAQRPEAEWISQAKPELRIVSEEQWAAAHTRLRGSRASYLRSTKGRLEGRPVNGAETKYMLAGLARCSLCGGGLTARTRAHGKTRVPFYECLTHRQRGASVCANGYQIRADLVEARILQLFDRTLLAPQVAIQAITLALAKLRPSGAQRAQQRKTLEAQRKRLEAERGNLTAAIARGGDLDSLVTALKTAEQQALTVTQHLSQLEAVDALSQVDTAALRRSVETKIKEWGQLAQRDPRQARQILRKLLADRLVFEPTLKDGAPAYAITGEGRLGPLLAGVLPAHQPGGNAPVLQRWWPQRDSNPCFSLERAVS